MPTISALELRDMPSLGEYSGSSLKIDTGTVRVWSSNMTIPDGEREPVQIEELREGKWVKYELPREDDGVSAMGTYPVELRGQVIEGVIMDGVVDIQLLRRG